MTLRIVEDLDARKLCCEPSREIEASLAERGDNAVSPEVVVGP